MLAAKAPSTPDYLYRSDTLPKLRLFSMHQAIFSIIHDSSTPLRQVLCAYSTNLGQLKQALLISVTMGKEFADL
jgi:hypothetical protein